MKIFLCILFALLFCLTGCQQVSTEPDLTQITDSYIESSCDASTTDKSNSTLTLSDFTDVVPGKTTYQDVYDICKNYPCTLMPSAYGMDLVVESGEEHSFIIRFDMDDIVISIMYQRNKL